MRWKAVRSHRRALARASERHRCQPRSRRRVPNKLHAVPEIRRGHKRSDPYGFHSLPVVALLLMAAVQNGPVTIDRKHAKPIVLRLGLTLRFRLPDFCLHPEANVTISELRT